MREFLPKPRQKSPYQQPLVVIPATIVAIAAAYYCVIRPVIEMYKIERYIRKERYEQRHEQKYPPQTQRAANTNALEDVVHAP